MTNKPTAINQYMQKHCSPSEAWTLKGLLRMNDLKSFEKQKQRFDRYLELREKQTKRFAIARAIMETE
jgi:hypothetical protein